MTTNIKQSLLTIFDSMFDATAFDTVNVDDVYEMRINVNNWKVYIAKSTTSDHNRKLFAIIDDMLNTNINADKIAKMKYELMLAVFDDIMMISINGKYIKLSQLHMINQSSICQQPGKIRLHIAIEDASIVDYVDEFSTDIFCEFDRLLRKLHLQLQVLGIHYKNKK